MDLIHGRLGPERISALEALLEDGNDLGFSELKADPGRVSVESLRKCVERLRCMQALRLEAEIFEDVPAVWLEVFRKRIASESVWEARRHLNAVRASLLATFCWVTS